MKIRHIVLNLMLCGVMMFAAGCTFPLNWQWTDTPQTDGGTVDDTDKSDDETPSWQMPSNGSSPKQPGTPDESATGIPDRLTPDKDKFAVFSQGGSSAFTASTWPNHQMFNCTFSAQNAVVYDGILNLSVSKLQNGYLDYRGYLGGEYQSKKSDYSYGYYSVSMKAADCPGVVSSFFTYTNRPYWDEIDIEFLGKDMTIVQFNYFRKGVGGHEFVYELGFDASEDFHEYGFDWRADSITWYVDGKAVYRAEGDMPDAPTRVMMNVWNSIGMDDWTGALDEGKLPATGQYQWVGYSAE